MPTWIEEGKWKCKTCGCADNEGRLKNCKGCGDPKQGDEETFFDSAPSYENRVTDPELLKQFSAGPDWECPHCGGMQRDDFGNCANCGGSKGSAVETQRRYDIPEPRVSHDDMYAPSPASVFSQHRLVVFAIVAAAIVAIGTLFYFLFRTTEKDVSVQSMEWTRTVEVERYKRLFENGFDTEIPSGAENITSLGLKHHHYREYQCGVELRPYTVEEKCDERCYVPEPSCVDNENGSRTCTSLPEVCVPVYCQVPKTEEVPKMCQESIKLPYSSWYVWRWKLERTVVASGNDAKSVRWPSDKELNLGANCTGREKERTGDKSEKYAITFVDTDGETYKYTPKSANEFGVFAVGDTHHVLYSIAGGIKFPEDM